MRNWVAEAARGARTVTKEIFSFWHASAFESLTVKKLCLVPPGRLLKTEKNQTTRTFGYVTRTADLLVTCHLAKKLRGAAEPQVEPLLRLHLGIDAKNELVSKRRLK